MNEPPHEEDASAGEGYYAEEAQPYPVEETYDPGAAYQDENAYYGAVDPEQQVYYDPNQQAYYDPNQQAYYDPNQQAYYDPNQQVHYDPGQIAQEGGAYYEEPVEEAAPPGPLPVVPRTKKKVAAKKRPQVKTGSPRRPTSGRPAPKKRPRPVYDDEGGFSFVTFLLGLIVLGLIVLAVYVVLPRDMSTVAGYVADPTAGEPRNLLAEVQQAMTDRSTELTFTEEEVNRYLNRRLDGTQKGILGTFVKFRGVYFDFKQDDKAEVVIEREIFGKPLTMSAKLAAKQFRGQLNYELEGWSIGRIQLGVPNAKPVVDLFKRLHKTLIDEYQAVSQMTNVRFEENQVVLDARL
ncbi:MAG TPA: hypothetical protein PLA50_11395 [Bacteroidia bacterium]|nr:hypothetical protein [Bacteroidia bacterium]